MPLAWYMREWSGGVREARERAVHVRVCARATKEEREKGRESRCEVRSILSPSKRLKTTFRVCGISCGAGSEAGCVSGEIERRDREREKAR